MVYTVSITSQGQVSIPVAVRRLLGLNISQKANLYVEDGKAIFEPVPDFLSLKGSLKTNKPPISNRKLHKMYGEYLAKNVT